MDEHLQGKSTLRWQRESPLPKKVLRQPEDLNSRAQNHAHLRVSSEGLVASNAPSLRFIEEGRLRSLAALQMAPTAVVTPP